MFTICTKANGQLNWFCTRCRIGTRKPAQTIDVWAYYNQADEVELFFKWQTIRQVVKTKR